MSDNFLSQEEIDALLGGGNTDSPSPSPGEGEDKITSEQPEAKGVRREDEPRNLELILDFPLHLSVRLGEAAKTLEEVRQVGPGNVLELDRVISDPVDVLVNGKLIARGNVVVVEENFGIIITHIFTPLERVKRLN